MNYSPDYINALDEYFEDQLKTTLKPKFSKCSGCSNNRQFIMKDNKLIYTCGSTQGKCGKQIEINLAKYEYYPDIIRQCNTYLSQHFDLGKISSDIDVSDDLKIQQDMIDNYKTLYDSLQKEYSKQNDFKKRISSIEKHHRNRINILKQQCLLKKELVDDPTKERKTEILREYISLNISNAQEYKSLLTENKPINNFIKVTDGDVKSHEKSYKLSIDTKKETKDKTKDKIEKKPKKDTKDTKKETKDTKEDKDKDKDKVDDDNYEPEPEPKSDSESEDEQESTSPPPKNNDFEKGDHVEWLEYGKITVGRFDHMEIKNGVNIAYIRTDDGKNITKLATLVKKMD